MSSHTLPTLDIDNLDYWHRTLEAFDNDAGLDHILNPANTAPEDPAEFTEYKRKQERLTLIILSSLPKRISTRLTAANLRLPPSLLTQQIIDTVWELTATDHSLLEENARNIWLTSIDDIHSYIKKQENIRIAMRNAKYPNIDKEQTSIQFMVHGIQSLPELHTTHEIMTQTPPSSIHEFCTRLQRAVNNIHARSLTAPRQATNRVK